MKLSNKKKFIVIVGLVITSLSAGAYYACEITSNTEISSTNINNEIPEQLRLNYTMNSFNLALLENANVSMTQDGVFVTYSEGEVAQIGIDSIYRCIKSFDTIQTMNDYFSYCNVSFNESVQLFMQDNWDNPNITFTEILE